MAAPTKQNEPKESDAAKAAEQEAKEAEAKAAAEAKAKEDAEAVNTGKGLHKAKSGTWTEVPSKRS